MGKVFFYRILTTANINYYKHIKNRFRNSMYYDLVLKCVTVEKYNSGYIIIFNTNLSEKPLDEDLTYKFDLEIQYYLNSIDYKFLKRYENGITYYADRWEM